MKNCFTLFCILLLVCSMQAQNTALSFNGSDTELEVANKPEFDVTDTYTIEAWIYAYNWQSQSWMGSIITKDTQSPDRGYAFRAGANGTLSFVMAVDNSWNEALTAPLMNTEQWHHVAVVINNGTITLYVDGEPSGNTAYSGTISPNEALAMKIGESAGFPGRYFDGIIDEVRMWGVARSQTELADNASIPLTGTESGLLAYFPMNEGSGLVAGNLVDPACSATLLNMDDNNWVDGFAIPNKDISVKPLKGVDLVNMKTRPVKLSIELKNLGLQSISDLEATVSLDGTDLYSETIAQTIASGEQIDYTFNTPINLMGLTDPEISVSVAHPDDENALNNEKSIVINTQSGNTVRLFNSRAHNFGADGQLQANCVLLPGNLAEYEQILMHIDLTCPSGGCDPWDQPAKINLETEQGNFEIARYITPYGIACGPWTVDVTDYKEVLTGAVNFSSFVQVWGSSGWLVTIDMELIEGNESNPHYKITPIWEIDYWVYGDLNINDNLPAVTIDVDEQTVESHIRMTISGHGQGNTDNAAEFSPKTHNFILDGNVIDNHYLWKDDCADNPCENQAGNWLFDRAGWCPGQEVAPYIVSTTNEVSPGSTIEFDYALEAYTNFLNTGYNGTSHTEPHYRIWSYFIEKSDEPFKAYNNLLADAIELEVSGTTLSAVNLVMSNNGTEPLSDFDVSYFMNNEWIATETVTATVMPGDSYSHQFSTISANELNIDYTFYGVVNHSDDENVGDDVVLAELDAVVVDHTGIEESANFELAPNPASIGEIQILADAIYRGSTIEVININGQVDQILTVKNRTTLFQIEQAGIYLIKMTDQQGFTSTRKLIVFE